MTTHFQRTNSSPRAAAALALVAILGGLVAACGGAPSEGGVDDPLKRLTEVALGTSTPAAVDDASSAASDVGATAATTESMAASSDATATVPSMDAFATQISAQGDGKEIPPLPTDLMPANIAGGPDEPDAGRDAERRRARHRGRQEPDRQRGRARVRNCKLATSTPPAKPVPLTDRPVRPRRHVLHRERGRLERREAAAGEHVDAVHLGAAGRSGPPGPLPTGGASPSSPAATPRCGRWTWTARTGGRSTRTRRPTRCTRSRSARPRWM
ncbi:MAG: hypothetical protein U0470_09855 [Anaerolineae bacterium]